MKNDRVALLVVPLLAALVGGLALSSLPDAPREAHAQSTSGKVQGLVPAGTASGSSVNPVVIGYVDTSTNTVVYAVADLLGERVHGVTTNGGSLTNVRPLVGGVSDGTVARTLLGDTSGRSRIVGAASAGSSAAGDPLLIAGVNSGTLVTRPKLDGSGVFYTAAWISPLDTLTTLTATTSNGTTNVTLQAAADGVRVYVGSLLFSNGSSTVAHTVTVSDTAGGSIAGPVSIPAGSSCVIGENGGLFQTALGAGLRFKIDSGGTGTDVTASGVIVVK